MDHLIRFTTAEGVEGNHQAGSLDDAIAFVERLRNVEGAADVRLYRLTEVPIEFRTYYRVEVGADGVEHAQAPVGAPPGEVPPAGGATPAVAPTAGPAPAPAPAPADAGGPPPVPVDLGPRLVPTGAADHATANGRRLFSR
jgi:hypothetical protein